MAIKKTDRGEFNQLLTFYTQDYGKLDILGRAIRKIKSKLRSGAELFYLSEIEFIQGKTYKTLTDAVLIESFPEIRKNLEKLRIAYQLAEVLDGLTPLEEKDEEVWQFIKEVFQKLNDYKSKGLLPDFGELSRKEAVKNLDLKLKIIYYYFFWNLVSLLGYQPELRRDSLCGRKIDLDLAKILKLILQKDWLTLSRLKLELKHLQLLKKASEWYHKEICGIK